MTQIKNSHKLAALGVLIIILIVGGYFVYENLKSSSPTSNDLINEKKNHEQLQSAQVIGTLPNQSISSTTVAVTSNTNSNSNETPVSVSIQPSTSSNSDIGSSSSSSSSNAIGGQQLSATTSLEELNHPIKQQEIQLSSESTLLTTNKQQTQPTQPTTPEQLTPSSTTTTTTIELSNPPSQLTQPDQTNNNNINNNELSSSNQQQTPPVPIAIPDLPAPEIVDFDLEFPANFNDRTELELETWKQFKRTFNKIYPNKDESIRRQGIFLANLRFIQGFNSRRDTLYSLDVNHFADFTRDEINQFFIGPLISWPETIKQLQLTVPPELNLLKETTNEILAIDWRNLTSEIVDQGTCRESSIFSTVASIESVLNQHLLSNNNNDNQNQNQNQNNLVINSMAPIKLSEQQLINCLAATNLQFPGSPQACSGFSSMISIFNLLQQQQIILTTNQNYLDLLRVTAQQQQQQQQPATGAAAAASPFINCFKQPPGSELLHSKLDSYMIVHKNNIPDAIFKSPLTIALDASQSTFHFYKSGLYHDDNCSTEHYNHHALLVGYSSPSSIGSNSNSITDQPYYIVRNSFGLKWGESGYIRLLKDEQRNKCLPQNLAIYPNLA